MARSLHSTAIKPLVRLPLLAWLIDRYGWRTATVALALLALILIPMVWLFLPDHPADVALKPYGAKEFTPKPDPVPGAARRTLRVLCDASRTGPFWLLAGTFAVCGASTNGVMWPHFAPAAHDHGMPITVAASLLAMIGASKSNRDIRPYCGLGATPHTHPCCAGPERLRSAMLRSSASAQPHPIDSRRVPAMTTHQSLPRPRASGEAPPPSFAHDGNLGFPFADPPWKAFFADHGIRVATYDDMGKLTHDLAENAPKLAYLPAADYFYIRDDPSYEPVASALHATDGTPNLTSLLVVRKSSGVTTPEQLRGGRLGYAHQFCTTSYFAPALLLADNGRSMGDFFARLVQVPPYQGQIDAVVTGHVDATMVQEDVWRKTPANADLTRVIAEKRHLPTPLVIVNAKAGRGFQEELTRVLLSHRPAITTATLFAGFATYQRKQVEEFFSASERAIPSRPF